MRVEINAQLGNQQPKTIKIGIDFYAVLRHSWDRKCWKNQTPTLKAKIIRHVAGSAKLRMDLIEPDMDMHNGVIFLGLPTEVVHKVRIAISTVVKPDQIIFAW